MVTKSKKAPTAPKADTMKAVSENAAGRAKADPRDRQIADLLASNADLRATNERMERLLRYEQVERQKLTDDVTAIATSLSRCGDGERVIGAMLFGAVRFHGTSQLMKQASDTGEAARPEVRFGWRAVDPAPA